MKRLKRMWEWAKRNGSTWVIPMLVGVGLVVVIGLSVFWPFSLPASRWVTGLIVGLTLLGVGVGGWLMRGREWGVVLGLAGTAFVFSLWLLGLWLLGIVWAEADTLQEQQCFVLPPEHATLLVSWPTVFPVNDVRPIRFAWVTGMEGTKDLDKCRVIPPATAGQKDPGAAESLAQGMPPKELVLFVFVPPELTPTGRQLVRLPAGGSASLEVRNRGTVRGLSDREVTLRIQTQAGRRLSPLRLRLEPSSRAALRTWVLGLDQRTPMIAIVGAVLSALLGVLERYSREKERLREEARRWQKRIKEMLQKGEVDQVWEAWTDGKARYWIHLEAFEQAELQEVFQTLGALKAKREEPDKRAIERFAEEWPQALEAALQRGWCSERQWAEVVSALLARGEGVREEAWLEEVKSRITKWYAGTQEPATKKPISVGYTFVPRAEHDLLLHHLDFRDLWPEVGKHLPWWQKNPREFAPGRVLALTAPRGGGKTSAALLFQNDLALATDVFPIYLAVQQGSSFDEVVRALQEEGARNLLRFLQRNPEQLLRLDGLTLRGLARCLLSWDREDVLEVLEKAISEEEQEVEGIQKRQEGQKSVSLEPIASAGLKRLRGLVAQATPYTHGEAWMEAAQACWKTWEMKVRWMLDDAEGLSSHPWALARWLLRWRQWGHEVWLFLRPEAFQALRPFLVPVEYLPLTWPQKALEELIRIRVQVVWRISREGWKDIVEEEAVKQLAQWLHREGGFRDLGQLAVVWRELLRQHPTIVSHWEQRMRRLEASNESPCVITGGPLITAQMVQKAIEALKEKE